jgi:hypothetical protein
MDGAAFYNYRGRSCIDGSFLARPDELSIPSAAGRGEPTLIASHALDPSLRDEPFVRLKPGPELVQELMNRGASCGRRENELRKRKE